MRWGKTPELVYTKRDSGRMRTTDLLFQVCVEEKLTILCTLHQVDLALGWAHRIVGLRSGQKVLDRSTVGLDRDEVMDVYRRVDPVSASTNAARRR